MSVVLSISNFRFVCFMTDLSWMLRSAAHRAVEVGNAMRGKRSYFSEQALIIGCRAKKIARWHGAARSRAALGGPRYMRGGAGLMRRGSIRQQAGEEGSRFPKDKPAYLVLKTSTKTLPCLCPPRYLPFLQALPGLMGPALYQMSITLLARLIMDQN